MKFIARPLVRFSQVILEPAALFGPLRLRCSELSHFPVLLTCRLLCHGKLLNIFSSKKKKKARRQCSPYLGKTSALYAVISPHGINHRMRRSACNGALRKDLWFILVGVLISDLCSKDVLGTLHCAENSDRSVLIHFKHCLKIVFLWGETRADTNSFKMFYMYFEII